MTGMRSTPRASMTGMWRTPRSRGMLNGLLLVLLALWGGLIPFVGPYFNFGFGSSDAWVYSTDRLVLSILPAIAVGVGGLILMISANRPVALFGSWLAILGGLWFVVGTTVSVLWNTHLGAPLGGQARQVAEHLSFFQGLGAIVILLAAVALGRFLVIGAREARRAETARAATERAAADEHARRGTSTAPEWEEQTGARQAHRESSRPTQRTWRVRPPSRH